MNMSDIKNQIKLMPVKELLGRKFFIPSYQRGYKWTEKQVEDLLNDLHEFKTKLEKKENCDEFYCLQPLAVKRKNESSQTLTIDTNSKTEEEAFQAIKEIYNSNIVWEVIDGQQRLTTIYLLLCYLTKKVSYSMSYETRENSFTYLESFSSKQPNDDLDDSNVDYFHMNKVFGRIGEWFKEKGDNYNKKEFEDLLLNKTQFIWYETNEAPIKVFTRLNIGKIGLTNSELIKALILSQSNFDERKQTEIANEWNEIEQSLQNEEFWYFIHDKDYNKPTRIDFLFDILCELYIKERVSGINKRYDKQKNVQQAELDNYIKRIGKDQYKTFRHFDIIFKKSDDKTEFEKQWKEVRTLFEVLTEWYKDVEYYHYIGYILCFGSVDIMTLHQQWKENKDKQMFTKYLKDTIKDVLAKNVVKQSNLKNILEQQYEMEIDINGVKTSIPKTVCKPILLLHNIQTVINQNKQAESEDKFKCPVFYRFPFYLYKTQDWDVEHIDSNTTNDLKDNFSKLLWLLQYKDSCYQEDTTYKNMYDNIVKHLTMNSSEQSTSEGNIKVIIKDFSFKDFDNVVKEIESKLQGKDALKEDALDDNQKNQIGNFTLLDSSTNRGYGNSIFPRKRLVIMAKDRCMSYQLNLKKTDENWEFVYEPIPDKGISAFIPPVTRNVFMKYYSPMTTDFTTWNKHDFDEYKKDIREVLKVFLTDNDNN